MINNKTLAAAFVLASASSILIGNAPALAASCVGRARSATTPEGKGNVDMATIAEGNGHVDMATSPCK